MNAPKYCRVLGFVASVFLSGIVLSKGAVHGEVASLIQTCGSRLDWIYATRYPAPKSPSDVNCSGIIKTALVTRIAQDCPAEAELVMCFNRARPLWVAFVRDCELFSEPYPCTLNEGECVKPGGPPVNTTSTTAKAEGESRRKAKAEGEAEGRRHMLSYRRLFAEGEGEGEGGAHLAYGPPGCFPDFYSYQDFDDWLQGKYQVPNYAIGSKVGPGGIIVWILHAMGILSMAFL